MTTKRSLSLVVLFLSACGADPPPRPPNVTAAPLNAVAAHPGNESERESALRYMAKAPHVIVGRVRSVESPPVRINGFQYTFATVDVEASFRDKTPATLRLFDAQTPHHARLIPEARILFTLTPEDDGSFRVRGSEMVVGNDVPRLRVTLPSLLQELEVRDAK